MSERSKPAAAVVDGRMSNSIQGDRSMVSRHSLQKNRHMGSNTPVTVLIVDDEDRNRRLLEVFVRADGYVALSAATGAEAIRIAATERPDLVLLDLMMPGQDGFDVARSLRADSRTAQIPVLIVSSLDDPASRSRASAAGAEELIVKPVDRWKLTEAMRRALDSRQGKDRRHG
ncbi:response regulator [Noviherbaspirillum aridicola]|uniref:Response regulatory domain-containing protein n=1 Tax=Noviherbaspirillum aridicola TaxID=2849687 RepID=A0ABQ4Q3H3_9BURK|nr:response regulator [Noviherbaspirillum aridicola]GIZ51576.1 hypothetical protein NCCP691_15900 [Noviherbaspirillum aridicola]